ncbi:LOW QUALITY PROTEIN: hypothetical protein HID58_090577 [Brassica napus]|uniref:Uncharacterized protein n=1 Tax=Brassica napus TaxID=3708 RepID=A0ABQ7WY98_BRANA|nr:LOW QUALITY PROTEIN: hypothetical protein HID58_090577 [Brassica napus]
MVNVSSFETSHVSFRSPTVGDEEGKIEEKAKTVPFYKLFSFSDVTDVLLMIVGFGRSYRKRSWFSVDDIVICLKFVYLGLGTFVAAFLQVSCWVITGERQAARIRSLYLKTILRQDIVFFDVETNTGEVVGRMSGDTVLILDAMVGKFIQLLATFLAGYALAFDGYLHFMLASIPLLAMAGAATSIISTKASSQQQAAYAKASTIVEQTCGSIRTVASFTREKQAISSYKELINLAYESTVNQGFSTGLGWDYALAIWFGGEMILRKGQAAAYKMFETIKRKPVIDCFDQNGKVLEDIQGKIELRDVFLVTLQGLEKRILSDDLKWHNHCFGRRKREREIYCDHLIERFYDPNSGQVLIDGVDLKEFQLKWIRGKIGLSGTGSVFFKYNGEYWVRKVGATVQEIEAAAKLATRLSLSISLPRGLETMVGEHGTQLSGGQKQRIAIARAILKDPRFCYEATSALDAESERVVQEALDRVMANRTTVIVAHRLSTVRNADVIAVLHRGQILLKDHEGVYSQLIRLQEINTESKRLEISNGQQDGSIRNGGNSGSRMHGDDDDEFVSALVLLAGQENTEMPKDMPKDYVHLTALYSPSLGLFFAKVIMAFFQPPHELRSDSRYWSIIFVASWCTLFGSVSNTYVSLFAVAGGRLIRRIRSMCFEKVVHMEVGWFDELENSSGAIGARLSADAALIRTLVGDSLALTIKNVATAVVGIIIAFVISWELAVIILVPIPLTGINHYVQIKFMKGFSADAKLTKYEEASQVASDAYKNGCVFLCGGKVIEMYKKRCEDSIKSGMKQGLVAGLGFGLSFFVLYSVYAACFYAGARLVKDGRTTYNGVFESAAASIFRIIDRKSKIDTRDESGMVLENTVALVGESGSGKSTVISLLQRFYDPDSGHITLDGVELKKLQLKWLRQQMGLVGQEPVLFNDTIRANIAYGKGGEEATEAEIVAASELSNAHKFISSIQKGYDTVVGERGIQLSGGQKQRVAIARAIVKEPKILLLDEATSALDAESERVVQDALDRVMVNRTTIVVAHRLSTIKNADIIAVVENGMIVEKGTHETFL